MSKTLKSSILVFLGGCAYGVMVPLVRSAYLSGFTTRELLVAQYLFAAIFLGIIVLLFYRRKIALRTFLELIGLGVIAACVSFNYYHALELLPAATAVTLLFQFVWIGVVLQLILDRRLPDKMTVLSVALVMVGTFFAAGVFEQQGAGLNPLGVFHGLLSAVFYAVFLLLSGKVAVELPTFTRTLITIVGSLLIVLAITPSFFFGGAFGRGLALFGLPLALFGIAVPILLIQKGAPHLSGGVITIMASSELPSGVIMAAFFLHERMSLLIVFGIVVILLGIALSQLDELRALRKSLK
jgi:drug/metabolite transporter (DMT)-like permease